MISLTQFILEKLSINFGLANSNYGQCVILAGGPGSGKGFIESTKVLANYRIFNVDDLKKLYIKMQDKGLVDDPYKYDMKERPEDTFQLHAKVKERGWKNKQRENFWKARSAATADKNPNILFDMVAGKPDDVLEIIERAKPLGYKITFIWICANFETAVQGNAMRDRHVPMEVLEKGHKEAYKTVNEIFDNKYPDITNGIDYAWIAFSAGAGRIFSKEYERDHVIKIKKDNEGKFVYDKKDFVENFLEKQMPLDPESKEEKKAKEEERKMRLTPSKYGREAKFSR